MKMHLKNSKKRYLRKRFIIVIVCLVLFVYFFLGLSKNVSYYYLSYSEKEARKIIDLSVGNAITDDILEDIKDKVYVYLVEQKNIKTEVKLSSVN